MTTRRGCFVVRESQLQFWRELLMDRSISMPKAIAFGFLLLILTAAGVREARGQALSGNLVGTVIDSASAVVTGGIVDATKIDTEIVYTTTPGGTGAYRF